MSPGGKASPLRDAVVVVAVLVLAGAVAGVVWPQLVTPVLATRTADGISTGEVELAHRISNDGWFAVLGAVVGLAGGAGVTAWRRRSPVVTLCATVLGAALAGGVCVALGALLGPEAAGTTLRDARVGATAPDRLVVATPLVYLWWPFAAALGALMVLWGPGRRTRD